MQIISYACKPPRSIGTMLDRRRDDVIKADERGVLWVRAFQSGSAPATGLHGCIAGSSCYGRLVIECGLRCSPLPLRNVGSLLFLLYLNYFIRLHSVRK